MTVHQNLAVHIPQAERRISIVMSWALRHPARTGLTPVEVPSDVCGIHQLAPLVDFIFPFPGKTKRRRWQRRLSCLINRSLSRYGRAESAAKEVCQFCAIDLLIWAF